MDVDVAAPSASSGEGKSYSIGTSALCFRKDGMEIENPIEDGLGMLSQFISNTSLSSSLSLLLNKFNSKKLGHYRKIVGSCI